MTDIHGGTAAIDRAENTSATDTHIDVNYPIDGDGYITSLTVFCDGPGLVTPAVFYQTSPGNFSCRAAGEPQACVVGVNVLECLLPCIMGDLIGCYSAGALSSDRLGAYGCWARDGNYAATGTGPFAYTWMVGRQTSMAAFGYSTLPGDPPIDIDAVLDEVKLDYVPAVNEWLFTNWPFISNFNALMGLVIWASQNGVGGGGGGGITLEQLQGVIDTHDAAVEARFVTQNSAMVGLYNDLVSRLNAVEANDDANKDTIMGAAEGNRDLILGAIGALDPATSDDVTALGAALTAEHAGLGVAIGAVGTAVAGVAAELTAGVASILAAITGLGTTILGALLGKSQLEQYLQDILDAIGEESPTGLPLYPGYEQVTMGTQRTFSTAATIDAATYGVNGQMDGVILTINSMPAGSYQQGGEDVVLHKYAGWTMFADAGGRTDELQWLGADVRVFMPKHFVKPALFIVSGKHGATFSVTPFVIN